MKQTFRRKKAVTTFAGIAGIIFLLCVVVSVILLLKQNYVFILVLFFPVLLGMLFAAIAFIEYRGSIEIDDQKVRFNYRIFSKYKEFNKSGVEFAFSEIESISKTYRKGDGIVSKDCFVYTIRQINKKQVEFHLYYFGKDEDSIFNIINEKIQTS